jgi:hypothetical protein
MQPWFSAVIRAARRWPDWTIPALLGAAVAGVEYAIGGLAPGRVLADAWTILATGVIAVNSFRPAVMSGIRRRLLLASLVPAILIASHLSTGASHHGWDWLYLSGILTFLIGVELSEPLGGMLNDTLRGLVDSGILRITNREMRRLRRDLRRIRMRNQNVAGAVVGTALGLSWFVYGARDLPHIATHNLAGLAIQSLAGVVAGQRLGRMVSYAAVWRLLPRRSTAFDLMASHPDGADGLSPIGRFYFRQSLIAALPAAYLATWWFIIPALPPIYLRWRSPYLGLLAIAIVFEVLAFLLPMRAIHQVMRNQSRLWDWQAARLIPRIRSIQASLVAATSNQDDISKQLGVLVGWHRTLRQAPTWPIDKPLRRWFTLNNLALFVPFLSYLVGNSELWQQIANVVGGLKH